MNSTVIILSVIFAVLVLALTIVWAKMYRRVAPSGPKYPVALPQSEQVKLTQQIQPVPTTLVVGDIERPAIMIQPYQLHAEDRIAPLQLRQEQLSGLEALVRPIPAIALAGANVATQTYMVRFAPEVASQLAAGSATLMRSLDGGVRAIAVGADGRIIGQGTLVAQASLGFAAAATAVWQVLAVVTAQYYLVGINHRLAAIEGKLDAVHTRMDDREMAMLTQHFKQLRSIQTALTECRLTELDVHSFVREVDTIDRECGLIMETCLISMDRGYQSLRTMNLQGTFDPSDEVRAAQAQVAKYVYTAQLWSMAALARVAAAEVRCALPVDRGIAQLRLRETQDELQRWEKAREQFTKLIKVRARDVSTTIHLKWWERDHDYRAKLLKEAKTTQRQLNEGYKLVARGLVGVKELAAEQQALQDQPLNLLVDVNDQGQITMVRRLLADEAVEDQPTPADIEN
jgi:hypothetical protein